MLLNQCDKPTKTHYRILLLSWAGWVFDFYDLMLYVSLVGAIGAELHLSKAASAYVIGASLAASAVGGVLFGELADRFGRKAVLQWTILTYSAGTFLCGLSPSLWMLLVFRVITGLGVGGEWATGQTYVGEAFPAKMRGRYGALMQTGAPIGIALAAVVAAFLLPSIGWRGCFFVSVLPAVLVVLVRHGLPESDVWLERKRLVREHGVSSAERQGGLAVLLSGAYRGLFVKALILAIFDMSAYWFTYTWMPTYLHEECRLSLTKSALWILVTQGGGVLGYTSFGIVADRLGRRPAYSLYSVTMALGLVMITLLWQSIAANPPLIFLFMFLVGFGTGMFGGYGPLFTELFPTSIRSTAMGSAFNLARGVQFFTPVAIATIASAYKLSVGISFAAVFAVLTGLWIWTFPETKGREIAVLAKEESGNRGL